MSAIFDIGSSKGDRSYRVRISDDGVATCQCPAYGWGKPCRHTAQAKARLATIQKAQANIRPLRDRGDGTFEVPLTRGKVAVIDAADADEVGRFNWTATALGYASNVHRRLYLHRLLMPGVKEVDHANGDKLDCRRSNLRAATRIQNSANRGVFPHTSAYKGVSWGSQQGKWRAVIASQHIGLFVDERDAALAYDEAARARWGEYARPNFA